MVVSVPRLWGAKMAPSLTCVGALEPALKRL